MPRPKKVKHYLITLRLTERRYLHAYLMCDDKRYIAAACNRMFDEAQKAGYKPLPIILQTDLSTGADIVRKIVSTLDETAKQAIEAATDYHFSCWEMSADHSANSALMELH